MSEPPRPGRFLRRTACAHGALARCARTFRSQHIGVSAPGLSARCVRLPVGRFLAWVGALAGAGSSGPVLLPAGSVCVGTFWSFGFRRFQAQGRVSCVGPRAEVSSVWAVQARAPGEVRWRFTLCLASSFFPAVRAPLSGGCVGPRGGVSLSRAGQARRRGFLRRTSGFRRGPSLADELGSLLGRLGGFWAGAVCGGAVGNHGKLCGPW